MGTLSSIIDRRQWRGKSADNRKRFLDRVKESVRESMPNILNNGDLKNVGKSGGTVVVKRALIEEPSFVFGEGGNNEHILPGNKEFVPGDRIKKEKSSGGKGSKGSPSGSGEDSFIVEITREEFLNYFFEDLELPDLVRKDLSDLNEERYKNAGYSTTGTPSRLAVVRSLKMAHLRKIALKGGVVEEKKELEELLAKADPKDEPYYSSLVKRLKELNEKTSLPFIDPIDLRYRTMSTEQVPITSATMVCIMDNSGSMGQREKTLSRKFFYLLYLFLERRYKHLNLVFISHTESAKEVSEQEFFNTKDSGGTMVSSALNLLSEMMTKKINVNATNVYVCQCSDGDNYSSDNETSLKILRERLLPLVQYWAYIQIEPESFTHSGSNEEDSLWGTYAKVSNEFKSMQLRHVARDSDIYPVFRNLFERKSIVK